MEDKENKTEEILERIAKVLERANISEYIKFIQHPLKIVMFNFLSGIARGFGIAIGMTLIAAIVVIALTKILSHLITLPVIGEQIAQIVKLVNQYLSEGQKLKLD